MKATRTIVCVIGTRPEAIKMAPIVHALRASTWARCVVVITAQHRDMLDQMLERLDIRPDFDLDLMHQDQTPTALLARMLPALETICLAEKPVAVLAQGDTTTVLGAALTAFHQRIAFGHVEAGLRSYDLEHPFPEEGYRQMVSRLAQWHFAPTTGASTALQAEGIAPERIHVTGNTGIDTLLQTVSKLAPVAPNAEKIILLTAHRRENFGRPMKSIFEGILRIAIRAPDARIIYPVHPNPNVHTLAHTMLGGHPQISLVQPLDYFEFVDLMRRCTLILTDSGGIQEEAPALGKPVLVLRQTTERPEGIAAGVSRLIGTEAESVESAVMSLLENPSDYHVMTGKRVSPYGDGYAADRIIDIIRTSAI
ncbi:MAG: UDP-N-acetylglucosamine 2-epimerase (non-hydrolyzing) [Comamonadaceae bacterium]|nr:UDP-N-acetylglucosamine 2-epimerase (non-hydrolyzing) [Comamonadaceae bacterium]